MVDVLFPNKCPWESFLSQVKIFYTTTFTLKYVSPVLVFPQQLYLRVNFHM